MKTLENNKLIAKNTIMLYIRMFILMGITFFTTRITFQILGVIDYGIINIVGGIVILFSFINNTLNSATQRFLNFELGKGDDFAVNKIFSASLNVYLLLIGVIIVLAETIGLWMVNNFLEIPSDRMVAANWLYQFTIATFSLGLIRVPYSAAVLAYERMSFYAYLSILETVLKLSVVYLLYIGNYDKLILYSFLNVIVALVELLCYKIYCNKQFATTIYHKTRDKQIFKQLLSFSGWSLFGSIASICSQQGINIILNIFAGVAINASAGIGNQIASVFNQFAGNFQIAFKPQITKLYAAGEYVLFHQLIFRSAKISYFLLLILAIPIITYCPFLINFWLGEVPIMADTFCRLIMISLMIDALSTPLWMSVEATGKIKTYQLFVSLFGLSTIPLSYLSMFVGFPAYSVWVIKIIMSFGLLIYRLIYLYEMNNFPSYKFIKNIILPIIGITCIGYIPMYYVSNLIPVTYANVFYLSIISLIFTSMVIYLLGLSKPERNYAISIIKNQTNKK